MKDEYFSIENEPAYCSDCGQPDPYEEKVDFVSEHDEMAEMFSSVRNEPAISDDDSAGNLSRWIEEKKSQCSIWGNLFIAILVPLIAGPMAVLGAIFAGQRNLYGLLYVVVCAPVVEEFLKQGGMIYLLERKPYRVFAGWQFVFSAVLAALIFSVIENLLYINVYVNPALLKDPASFAEFRWTVCTSLHIACAMIASMGMIRVWKKQLADGKPADLSAAYPYFTVAICVHGVYNLFAFSLEKLIMK